MKAKDNWQPTAFDREHMVGALFDQLRAHDGQWVAVRVQGCGWEVVKPRSQEAILDALETIPPADAKTGERGAVIEECARVCETFPAKILEFWDRPGGPPGNGWRQSTAKDVAAAIRALSQPLPDAPIVSGEG